MREVEAVPSTAAPHPFVFDGEVHWVEFEGHPSVMRDWIYRSARAVHLGVWTKVQGNRMYYQSD